MTDIPHDAAPRRIVTPSPLFDHLTPEEAAAVVALQKRFGGQTLLIPLGPPRADGGET